MKRALIYTVSSVILCTSGILLVIVLIQFVVIPNIKVPQLYKDTCTVTDISIINANESILVAAGTSNQTLLLQEISGADQSNGHVANTSSGSIQFLQTRGTAHLCVNIKVAYNSLHHNSTANLYENIREEDQTKTRSSNVSGNQYIVCTIKV